MSCEIITFVQLPNKECNLPLRPSPVVTSPVPLKIKVFIQIKNSVLP